ncbi:SF1B family DNA helicase RecD2 [Persicimonas caeni]|nr:ATP-dependent RecD-like DNA helicase [Persicimonas caeni]
MTRSRDIAARSSETQASEMIKGTLSKIRFESDNGEFAVCELEMSSGRKVTIVGNIMSSRPGETVEVNGQWQNDARYGRQFAIDAIRPVPPTTREGIEKYLSSGFVEGIGPVLAERIVDHFGEDTLDLLDENPERITEVDGIGKVRAKRIMSAWAEQRQVRSVMVFLQSHGVSPGFAVKIWKQYAERSIRIVRENPYKLAEDIHGIGFKTADAIALEAGLEKDSLARLRAGLLYCLREAHSDGHMYLPLGELKHRAVEILGVPDDMLGAAVADLAQDERIVTEPLGDGRPPAVFRAPAYRAELGAARHLGQLVRAEHWLTFSDLDDKLADIERSMGVELARAQKQAALAIFEHKTVVVTGGPGTGKTTIIRAVVTLAEQLDRHVKLAAPTGRAAKRMNEATGRDASTVHRLLEFTPKEGGFKYNEERPLDVDLLIVDEASMIDTYLLHAIVRALPESTALLLVGDVDQLPSVGPGNVLGDIIDSDTVEVVRLTEVFRQAEQSAIVTNAHRINAGQMPVVPQRKAGELVDFYTIAAKSPQEAQEKIIELVSDRVPNAFGYDPIDEVQILSPMHKGDVGCSALNRKLQARFNPGADALERGSKKWKVGDKVMQIRNNYELEVFNGDIGQISLINRDDDTVWVNFDGRRVTYDFTDLDELVLAYAITVHKSQGSEYAAVILPVLTQHYVMLQRNLLYTAVTRAKKLVVVVGSEKAVGIAVRNNRSQLRYTRLDERLREIARK